MSRTRVLTMFGGVLILVFAFLAGFAKGQPLRMRKVTLQPGGVLGLHNHVDRPAVTYMLQGQMTYHQDGKPDMVANPGDGFAEGRATTHWAESTGKVPAVWIAVDIPKP